MGSLPVLRAATFPEKLGFMSPDAAAECDLAPHPRQAELSHDLPPELRPRADPVSSAARGDELDTRLIRRRKRPATLWPAAILVVVAVCLLALRSLWMDG